MQCTLFVLDGRLGDGGGLVDFIAFGADCFAHFVLDVDGGAEVETAGEIGGGIVIIVVVVEVVGGGGECR